MNTISFISANFVARQIGYHMTEGWMQGDTATQEYFKPLATFAERFGAMLGEVKAMGFEAIDLWIAHLNPAWATAEHIATAHQLLSNHGLKLTSLAAWCGNVEALEGNAKLARALGTDLLGGGAPVLAQHRAEAIAILKHHGVRLGVENHPEKSSAELLAQIGDGADGHIGAAPDTGWWVTQHCNPAKALRDLKDHIFTVHLKDVLTAGTHDTCRLGRGVADIEGCVGVLKEIGYSGTIGIEHEPEHYDPTEDIKASKGLLEGWLK
jgi:sugar phosphate isomerase/epimerase